MGIINIGGNGTVTVDGKEYNFKYKDGMYIGMGAKDISFKSEDPKNPAKFYLNSAPAHKTYPTVFIDPAKDILPENKKELGCLESANHRTINKYILPGQVESCQLEMGMTCLEPGSVWNTMPCHTHDRRMEVYLYFDIPEDAFVIGMVGRISPQKAPDVFIRVAEKIKNVIPNSYFMIVGDGEHRDEIQQYAKEYGFEDKLLITGWVDNSMDYVELFDVAMLISRWEGFGLVLPEYMLSEKPIIATKVDAIPNIIKDNENGILVEVDKVEEIFNAVLEICENRALADKFIKNGLKDVYNFFDVERVAMEHQCMFQEMRRINY